MDEIKAKQQVVEKIKESTKILVTVSDNPSVDALSAALGLTLLLDKQEKYATSIFSGETPPAIAFLEPEKTFDDTTDSLRDFIIALNKEKADHLRYKVEGDSVKIFITPYKTTIDQSDLEFSQGDYNVELVIALGVDNPDHLDKALADHGQILHDAAIITMTAGDQSSSLGGIDWHDSNSSSLSEMIAGLGEAMKTDKKKPLVDAPIATALLTGIVAETDRFSNEHTTSKVMTVAATLMAAGADQQLIATELQAAREVNGTASDASDTQAQSNDVEVDKDSGDGSLTIKNHDPSALSINHEGETLADLDRRVMGEEKAKEKVIDEVEAAEEEAASEEVKEAQQEPEPQQEQGALYVPQEPEETPQEPESVAPEDPETPVAPEAPEVPEQNDGAVIPPIASIEPTFEETPRTTLGTVYEAEDAGEEPILGGTLNATTEQAAEDARRAIESDQNKTILSHAYLGTTDTPAAAQANVPIGFPGTPSAAPGSVAVNAVPDEGGVHSAYAAEDQSAPSQDATFVGVGGERVIQPLDTAATPVAPAYGPAPVLDPTPTDLGLPLPPPIPDFSQVNGAAAPAPGVPVPPAAPQAGILGDILAPEPNAYETSNAVAAPNTAYAFEDPTIPAAPQQSDPSDPGQFQIPPQQ